jgi:hypothetical protein
MESKRRNLAGEREFDIGHGALKIHAILDGRKVCSSIAVQDGAASRRDEKGGGRVRGRAGLIFFLLRSVLGWGFFLLARRGIARERRLNGGV